MRPRQDWKHWKRTSLLTLLALVGCPTTINDRYCDDQGRECTNPAYPFCDLEGTYPASGGIANYCIPDPRTGSTDGGTDAPDDSGDGGSPSDAGTPTADARTTADASPDAADAAPPDDPDLLFRVLAEPSSLDNLPARLAAPERAPGPGIAPALRLHAADARASGWSAAQGPNLTLDGSGPMPTFDWGAPLLGARDTSVRFRRGRAFRTTEPLPIAGARPVIELVFRVPDRLPTAETLFALGMADTDQPGVQLDLDTSARLSFTIRQAPGVETTLTSAALTPGAWHHALVLASPQGFAAIYLNGSRSGSLTELGDLPALSGNAQPLALGSTTTGANPTDAAIAAATLWLQGGDLLPGTQATLARRRSHQLTGIYPQKATGTALAKVATRESPATLDKLEADGSRRLYTVGPNWLRLASRPDAQGKAFWGYLAEAERTNHEPYSEQLEQGGQQLATVVPDTHIAPDGSRTADTIREDNTEGRHRVGGPGMPVTAGELHTVSVFAKPLNRKLFSIETGNAPVALASAIFDLEAGEVAGNFGADFVAAAIAPYGNGYFRCTMVFRGATDGGAGIWLTSLADTATLNYQGQNLDALVLWGRQYEQNAQLATSYIATGDSPVTRAPDTLVFVGDDGNVDSLRGQLAFEALLEDGDHTVLAQLSDDSTDDTHEISAFQLAPTYQARRSNAPLWTLSTSWPEPPPSPLNLTLRATWRAGAQTLTIDETEQTGAISAVPEAPLTSIYLGTRYASGLRTNGLLRNVEIRAD
jgi:hypothetical protein